jgi:branched-chain amino acid transport system ATP-binding protein
LSAPVGSHGALLEVVGLHTGYGASPVLHGVQLHIAAGEALGLLGRNGMGKTTLVRAVMGLIPSRSGRIVFDGESIFGQSPQRIARRGIGLVPEGRQIFPNLTVEEHLSAFQRRAAGDAANGGEPWSAARVFALFPRLAERRRHLGHQLSGGEQQMLAIGRALVTNPRLLILDEATEGLAPLVREEIWRCLATLRRSRQAILVIDKYVQRLIGIADRHVILEKGRVAWSGSSAELDADRSLWTRYLGV